VRYWRTDVKNVPVPVAPATTPLAPKNSYYAKVYIWADRSNTTTVCIGPKTLICLAAARPNSTITQLDPGRGLEIYVDDPLNEAFDLGDYFCASDNSTDIQFIYVSPFNFVNSK
jgi:hypothetical protein